MLRKGLLFLSKRLRRDGPAARRGGPTRPPFAAVYSGAVESLAIAPCTPEALAALDAAMPSQHNRIRYNAQLAGEGLFLVALLSGAPVGRVLLRWRSTDDTLIRLGIAEPYVESLGVVPEFRSRGIGTALMQSAEQAAHERGHATMGLSVGVENIRARALYVRLGYRETDFPPFDVRWGNRDGRGVERIESETCTYFTRRLVPLVGF